jgi:hypothetical protein
LAVVFFTPAARRPPGAPKALAQFSEYFFVVPLCKTVTINVPS